MFIAQLEHPAFSKYRLDTLRDAHHARGAPVLRRTVKSAQVIERMHMRDVTICYA